jgi:hypothetical protein
MENLFPVLKSSGYKITSPATIEYNCIAWAADDPEMWWWPDPYYQYYWPPDVPRKATINAFVKAFETLGYMVCQTSTYVPGYEKIAIYAKTSGEPTHAARQLGSGKWTSKVGSLEDIEHDDHAGVNGETYGSVVVFMKRPKKNPKKTT